MMYTRAIDGVGRCIGYGAGAGPMMYGAPWMMWMMMGVGVLLLIAVIVVGVLIYRKNAKKSSGNALELLKARYVKGEISEEEYLRMKEVLNAK